MKTTLTFDASGACTNAPEGCWATVRREESGAIWARAERGNVLSIALQCDSVECGQRDLEATLWLLGVLPLPEWQGPYWSGSHKHWELHRIADAGSGYRAEVAWHRGGFRVSWLCADGKSWLFKPGGATYDTLEQAQHVAAALLRALIAQAIRENGVANG